ncbi:type II toxin-antitoxin system HigB family toxin [Imperialibacter sp.]|uniref:type II toxin-antitoxin system HigB family toxin n=1 Tax=Imperialibacter sp. TaxID=2038411 RepID=UPI0032EE2CE3
MRAIAKRTLKEFWSLYHDSELPLIEWHTIVSKSSWQNPNEVKEVFPSVDFVGNNRAVFNICHNKYRLVVVFRYQIQMVYIRFIGTQKDYDSISNIKEI